MKLTKQEIRRLVKEALLSSKTLNNEGINPEDLYPERGIDSSTVSRNIKQAYDAVQVVRHQLKLYKMGTPDGDESGFFKAFDRETEKYLNALEMVADEFGLGL